MRKRRFQQGGLAACLLVAGVLCAAGAARGAIEVRDVRIAAAPLASIKIGGESTYHGYREIRIALTNRHPGEERTVTFDLPADLTRGSEGHYLAALTRGVKLAPRSSTIVSIFQPPVPFYGDNITVRVDGRAARLPIDLAEHMPPHASFYGSGTPAAVLFSRSIDINYHNQLLDRSTAPSGQPDTVHQSELPIEQWSSHWLGYTRYDGVVLTVGELNAAPPKVSEALRRYVTAGGTILIIGAADPRVWPTGPSERFGDVAQHPVGFGQVWTTPHTKPDAIPHGDSQYVGRSIRQTLNPFHRNRTVEQANRDFEVVGEVRVPVRGLLILMIVFAVLIGPVNLYVLARKNRRMWMLWTVPAFSLVTCGLIWLVNVFAEGFTTTQRSAVVTLLDQRSMTATSLGMTGLYAPLAPGGGLRFSRDTEVTPQIGMYSGRWTRGWARTAHWGDEQHLRNGWVRSRLPAHFLLRRSDTLVRERLTFSRAGDAVRVVNGLGVDIQKLTYVADDGAIHEAGAILAGQAMNMTVHGGNMPADTRPRWRDIYASSNWPSEIDRATHYPGEVMVPNSYVAVVGGSPFLDTGLEGTDHRLVCVVIGLTRPIDQANPGAPAQR